MGKKGLVSEMLEARCIVSHDVVRSWDVLGHRAIPVLSLMSALEVAESWARPLSHGGSLVHTTHRGSVVCPDGQCSIPNVVVAGHDSQLSEDSRVLQVTVGHVAGAVGRGNEACLDLKREGGAPHVGRSMWVIVDPAHAHLGSISGAKKGGFLRN